MNIIIYICSTKIRLKTIQAMQTTEILQKIIFKDYFFALPDDNARVEIRNKIVPRYVSYPSFYRKINDNSFTELEFEKLEEITNQQFER